MKKKLRTILWCLMVLPSFSLAQTKVFPGADNSTPSKAQYFSWINNTNEGATEKQTMVNLAFFEWMKENYGMQLDIYAFDAGAIDGKRFYGSIYSDRFKKQFPNGFDPIYKKAKELGIRLGVWGGPDGFGNSAAEEKARTEQMVKLCKDYDFALFKFDAVCGPLPSKKEDAFIEMMKQCRMYSPDLILLNHRLGLKKAKEYATTSLWEGSETYIDVFMTNNTTAPHNRAGALERGLPPALERLTEDHGVCLSSCLDYWEDDIVLQAFNRSLILAPELYGSPWLLRDNEFPQLARYFNLHRKYGKILVKGFELPKSYGSNAVTRGNSSTRIITLRNLSWNKKEYSIQLDKEIGIEEGKEVTLVQLHPTEKIIGTFSVGETTVVTVDPYRACMLLATTKGYNELAVSGTDYRVICNVPNKSVIIDLLAYPGESKKIALNKIQNLSSVKINGKESRKLVKGKALNVKFPGNKIHGNLHRKLLQLDTILVHEHAEALYEATVFSADNNALEVRSLKRSGQTNVPEVKAARDALFEQPTFTDRGIWDKNLFDGNFETGFWPSMKYDIDQRIKKGTFRLDLGAVTDMDKLVLHVPDYFSLHPMLRQEGNHVEVSTNLIDWETITYLADKEMVINFDKPVRYLRFKAFPRRIVEIEGFKKEKPLDRSSWRASNLFAHSSKMQAKRMWAGKVTLRQIANNSYLCVALNGKHGVEGAYAAAKIGGELRGAPRRAVSYPSNTWEYINAKRDKNYTYYIPLMAEDIGKPIEVFVMGYNSDALDFKPEVWLTSYPKPYETIRLEITRK